MKPMSAPDQTRWRRVQAREAQLRNLVGDTIAESVSATEHRDQNGEDPKHRQTLPAVCTLAVYFHQLVGEWIAYQVGSPIDSGRWFKIDAEADQAREQHHQQCP